MRLKERQWGHCQKKENVQNEWDKQKQKEMQIEKDIESTYDECAMRICII